MSREDEIDLEYDANEKISRRKALSVLGMTAVGALAGIKSADAHGAGGGGPSIEDFYVEGRWVMIRRDHPEYYEITQRTISPDLRERYGDPVLERTERFEKTRHEKMLLPDDAEYRVENEEYSANIATEEEWREYFLSQRQNRSSGGGVASLMPLTMTPNAPSYEKTSNHEPGDDTYPMGVWTYSKEDTNKYKRSSPINVVGVLGIEPDECKRWNTGGDPSDMISELVNGAGWTRNIEEYEKYAWNRVDETFESNQNEQKGNGSTGESWGRVSGGYHVRGWEWVEESPDDYPDDDFYGRYASLQCHFDSRVPHVGTGLQCAQREVGGIFRDAFNWYVYPDYFDLGNEDGTAPDSCTTDTDGTYYHDGLATAVVWGECSNVDEQGAQQHHESPASGC